MGYFSFASQVEGAFAKKSDLTKMLHFLHPHSKECFSKVRCKYEDRIIQSI